MIASVPLDSPTLRFHFFFFPLRFTRTACECFREVCSRSPVPAPGARSPAPGARSPEPGARCRCSRSWRLDGGCASVQHLGQLLQLAPPRCTAPPVGPSPAAEHPTSPQLLVELKRLVCSAAAGSCWVGTARARLALLRGTRCRFPWKQFDA